ncbi:MAG: hypothetical protein EOO40_05325 [Deltaproteobacteria bacterium]|nr:MAG: hypothetical protein EOO40_05325 [Deltaproteobacteria bacterium]
MARPTHALNCSSVWEVIFKTGVISGIAPFSGLQRMPYRTGGALCNLIFCKVAQNNKRLMAVVQLH